MSATRFSCFDRAWASSVAIWIDPSGPVCQKYGFGNCVVSVSPEFIGVICGIFASIVTVCCCCVAEVSDMLRMNTAPWSMSLRASAAEMSGRDWSSSIRSSIFLLSTPPWRLISSAPKMRPSVEGSEYGFDTPTRSVITPILMVSCACAPHAHSAAAANARNRLILLSSLVQKIALAHPAGPALDRLAQLLGLALIVMGRALDHLQRLVPARGRVMDDRGVRLRNGIVGRV